MLRGSRFRHRWSRRDRLKADCRPGEVPARPPRRRPERLASELRRRLPSGIRAQDSRSKARSRNSRFASRHASLPVLRIRPDPGRKEPARWQEEIASCVAPQSLPQALRTRARGIWTTHQDRRDRQMCAGPRLRTAACKPPILTIDCSKNSIGQRLADIPFDNFQDGLPRLPRSQHRFHFLTGPFGHSENFTRRLLESAAGIVPPSRIGRNAAATRVYWRICE